jgi:hypothetical protein
MKTFCLIYTGFCLLMAAFSAVIGDYIIAGIFVGNATSGYLSAKTTNELIRS